MKLKCFLLDDKKQIQKKEIEFEKIEDLNEPLLQYCEMVDQDFFVKFFNKTFEIKKPDSFYYWDMAFSEVEDKLNIINAERNKFITYGKLGGRPRIRGAKEKTISVRFSAEEYSEIYKNYAESEIEKFSDFCRYRMQGKSIENQEINIEKNKHLAQYSKNFILLKNFIQSGIFNSSEKEYFLKELDDTIQKLKDEIKW